MARQVSSDRLYGNPGDRERKACGQRQKGDEVGLIISPNALSRGQNEMIVHLPVVESEEQAYIVDPDAVMVVFCNASPAQRAVLAPRWFGKETRPTFMIGKIKNSIRGPPISASRGGCRVPDDAWILSGSSDEGSNAENSQNVSSPNAPCTDAVVLWR
jgi:hypothetical protein